MGVKWTAEQQKVIELRGRNILVSAAAGSGKTAVLVERIIRMLTDETEPVSVDRLLVVTFTEAAAAEMRERIRTAIEEKLVQTPGNEHLRQQATLIHSARITTIHSFCLSVIRDHFPVINLDPTFRIGEEGELKLLRHDVLGEVLEEKYASGEQRFLDFAQSYASGKNDKKLEELILKIYDFSRSYPDADGWLADCVEAYAAEDAQELEESRLVRLIMDNARRYLKDAEELLRQGLAVCREADGPLVYEPVLEKDMQTVGELLRRETFSGLLDAAREIKWTRLAVNRDKSVSEEKISQVKALREEMKGLVKDIKTQYFSQSMEEILAGLRACRPMAEELTELVRTFARAFEEKKRERNMIDFSDMEQYALRILTEGKEGGFAPSAVAAEYQRQFAEILIDEYQDSNLIQEAILTSVSTVREGRYNIFMVGDVKQSIYRFRLSRPELFMEKFNTYSTEDSVTQRIDLHKNFRSRAEVIDSVNAVFEQIMTRGLGGIAYDDRAALYVGADYAPAENCGTEALVIDCSGEEVLQAAGDGQMSDRELETQAAGDGQISDRELEAQAAGNGQISDRELEARAAGNGQMSDRELEARAVAGRIRELMREHRVTDRETGELRPVRYSDIVILTRSVRGYAELFTEVLTREGIPAYAGTREGYFSAQEIGVLLDYLRVLDNRRQDIPLAAVLASPIGGLSAQDMAEIRSGFQGMPFYRSAERYRSEGMDGALRGKLEACLGLMDELRGIVPYTPMHELLWKILKRTGYRDYVSAMPAGEQRRANIDMLIEKARAFESTSYRGLFHFVRYIEQLRKYDVDYGEANVEDERSDTVRIMTIHKSKGLEFPIVIAAGMGKRFNLQDARSRVVLHSGLGIGLEAVDLKRRVKCATIVKKAIQKEETLDTLAEELRILYVAFTRAKEKLILTGTVSNPEKLPHAGAAVRMRQSREFAFSRLSRAATYWDWILPALERIPEEIPITVRTLTAADIVSGEVRRGAAERLKEKHFGELDANTVYDAGVREYLEEQFGYRYPYAGNRGKKLKFTVSELKKRTRLAESMPELAGNPEEAGELLYEEPEVIPLIPKFLKEEEKLSGASRGTAYHRILELIDFAQDYDESRLERAMQGFADAGKIEADALSSVRAGDIMRFLESRVGQRMKAAAKENLLRREQPFVLGVEAGELYPDEPEGEPVLVQGIIDVYFEEEDGIVLLDYKTDRIFDERELADRYHAQLDYYAQALERLTGKKVKEKIIYSFTMQREIRLS